MPEDFVAADSEGAKFLDRDFNQCFTQMRHYDAQIVDICKFAFTGYIAVSGAAVALYKYGTEKGIDYTPASVAILTLAAVFGLMLLGLVVRNRVYFVLMARYINEHRRFFLKDRPLGFENDSRMYTNPHLPPYFSWLSSQSWLMYVLALLNATMLGMASILVGLVRQWPVCVHLTVAGGLFAIQLVVAISYLLQREGKSAGRAVWGKK